MTNSNNITRPAKTFDVVFNTDTESIRKGFEVTIGQCMAYIKNWNGTNHSYFADYKGGTVSVVCNETEEVYHEENVQ